jgi:high-affinity iron transporter
VRKRVTLPAPAAFVAATDPELAALLPADVSAPDRAAVVAHLRAEPVLALGDRPADPGRGRAEALVHCRAELGRVRERWAAGDRRGASDAADSAYLDGFERVEKDLGAVAPDIVREVEGLFARLREAMQAGLPAERIATDTAAIESSLDRAGRIAEAGLSGAAAFGQSFVIIVREGFEIILVLAALATYLIRVGQREKTLWLYGGAGAAIVVSLGVAGLARWVLALTPARQELLEGVTMLVAAAVLFWMSHWILSRSQAEKWNAYIQRTASRAIKAGSLWTLAGVGFLVVFREGVETVLFYQSLSFAAPGATDAIWVGFGVGCIALLIIAIAMFQLGLRMPLRPFFVGTSVLLYLLAFVFVGNGLHELQAGGYLSATAWRWLPSFPLLGLHPTFETLVPQALLAALGLAGVRAIRRGGAAPALNGTMQPVPAREQLLAIQSLAARLRERAARHADPEVRNLAGQIEAAARSEKP